MAGRLHGLDALRGIAAIVVAWHHLAQLYGLGGPPVAAISAVDLFLVMSGFIMARTYEGRMPAPRAFLSVRYRRLLPVMSVGTLIGAFALMLDHGFSAGLVAVTLATLFFLPFGHFAANIPAWSLFIEVLANYLHSRIFAVLSVRALIGLALALGIAFVAGTLALGEVAWGTDPPSLAIATLRCLHCYVVGIIIFRLRGERPLGASPGWALAATGLLLGFGETIAPVAFSILFAVIAAPLLVRAVLDLRPSPIASAAGDFSFPLYAVHFPVMMVALHVDAGPGIAAACALLLGAAVTVIERRRRRPWAQGLPADRQALAASIALRPSSSRSNARRYPSRAVSRSR